MAAIRFEQVQRFNLGEKIFWGYGYFNPLTARSET